MSEIIGTYDPFTEPICNQCKHHISGSRCRAFEYIPDVIFDGTNAHETPLPNQGNTIVFEAKETPLKSV